MQDLRKWLSDYGEIHQNPINQRINKVAVPSIFLSLVGLIWTIPSLSLFGQTLNWVWVAAIPIVIFYIKLSLSVFLMMLGFSLACISLVWSLDILQLPVFLISMVVLALSGGLQFIGYKIEGKQPPFKEYILFVLIGPIWVFRHK
ncbi:Mpo1-like protein [Vibrio sp.]|uniref:Mpo1 family 2-hydroxy fatty acid dioxygenase n=1 Tax=Vibrio sp. TaxID=678 RepID=UPI00311FE1D4